MKYNRFLYYLAISYVFILFLRYYSAKIDPSPLYAFGIILNYNIDEI